MQLIIPLAAIQIIGVCVIITVNDIIAGTAKQAIVPDTAQQGVIAIKACQIIVTKITKDPIHASSAKHVLVSFIAILNENVQKITRIDWIQLIGPVRIWIICDWL